MIKIRKVGPSIQADLELLAKLYGLEEVTVLEVQGPKDDLEALIDALFGEALDGTAVGSLRHRHHHQCGVSNNDLDDYKGYDPMRGCGHIWFHDTSRVDNDDDYDAAHKCPKCGRGLWRIRLEAIGWTPGVPSPKIKWRR